MRREASFVRKALGELSKFQNKMKFAHKQTVDEMGERQFEHVAALVLLV